ncbi:MAG: ABC transporter permease [Leptospirales bacterium]|nr:ABC transporter permease [Leptospirales bacterium]
MNSRQMLVALSTIVRREIVRILRIWIQTLVPPAITMALYFLIFGRLIGSRVGDVQGMTYLRFIAPGLILMAVITNAYANVSSSFFSARFQRNIEELLVSPTPNWIIVLGYSLGGVVRSLMVGGVVLLIAAIFQPMSAPHPLSALSSCILASFVFSLGGFLNACYARKFDDISLIPTFILTPLTYLGGVFFSADMLSPFWRGLALANPILYLVNAFRFGLTGHSDIAPELAYLTAAAAAALLFLINVRLLKVGRGLRQ